MKKILISFLVLIVIIFLTNAFGYFGDLNRPINNLVAGEPNRYCKVDSDCQLKSTVCNGCDCGEVVNKDWDKFCPLKDNKLYKCKLCPIEGKDFEIKCIDNQCLRYNKNAIVIESKYEAIKMAQNNSEGLVDFINKYQSLGEIESSANYNIKDDYWNVSFYPRGTVDLWYEIHISQQGKIIYEGQGVGG